MITNSIIKINDRGLSILRVLLRKAEGLLHCGAKIVKVVVKESSL